MFSSILTQSSLENAAPCVRFAPSPNGYMHLGHAYAGLFALRTAKALNAKFIIRIEDIDSTRCNEHYEKQMLEDLEWLGIIPDEPPLRQSNRIGFYKAALKQIHELGLLFPSILSRKELAQIASVKEAQQAFSWPRDPDGGQLYAGEEFALLPMQQKMMYSHPEGCALRLNMDKALLHLQKKTNKTDELIWQEIGIGPANEAGLTRAHPEDWGHTVLKRRDLETSYHIACVVDDALQHVTHVVRGQDMFYATSLQLLLQRLLGFPTPIYCHHPLVVDDSGRKLSKSDNDLAIKTLRERGWSSQDVIAELNLPDFSQFQSSHHPKQSNF